MTSFVQLSPPEAEALIDLVIDTPWSWRAGDLEAYVKRLGARTKGKPVAGTTSIVTKRMPAHAGFAVAKKRGRVNELVLMLTSFVAEPAPPVRAAIRAIYDHAVAHVVQRLGPALPRYPRGKTPGDIYGSEDRYTAHRLPNGLDIFLPRGVDPYTPIELDPDKQWLAWHLDETQLRLGIDENLASIELTNPRPPTVADGVALTWDGVR